MVKRFTIFSSVFLAMLMILFSFFSFFSSTEKISNEVFRLHIVANSDSNEDQSLKLKVRDEILTQYADSFMDCKTMSDSIKTAENHLADFKKSAEYILRQNNCDDDVFVEVGKEYFSTREYDDITLPSGFYNSLKIVIGSGEGKNWWCVMFPAICLPEVSDSEIKNVVSDEEYEIISSSGKYKLRFKAVEIYNSVKNKISESIEVKK